jgi:hypothetical protein
LARKSIALKFNQKVLIFRKNYTPKFLGCYTVGRGIGAGRHGGGGAVSPWGGSWLEVGEDADRWVPPVGEREREERER